jgi:hypothetical protein
MPKRVRGVRKQTECDSQTVVESDRSEIESVLVHLVSISASEHPEQQGENERIQKISCFDPPSFRIFKVDSGSSVRRADVDSGTFPESPTVPQDRLVIISSFHTSRAGHHLTVWETTVILDETDILVILLILRIQMTQWPKIQCFHVFRGISQESGLLTSQILSDSIPALYHSLHLQSECSMHIDACSMRNTDHCIWSWMLWNPE